MDLLLVDQPHDYIPIDRIVERTDNIRQRYRGIKELAESIHTHGLLENLVVCNVPGSDVHELFAGYRRFRALRLLQEQGRPYHPDERGVSSPMCLIRQDAAQFAWDNFVENVKREDIPAWHLGRRLNELSDQGITQGELAARGGISPSRVSYLINLHRGLHPDVVMRLDTLNYTVLSASDLYGISRLTDRYLYPDRDLQLARLEKILSRGGKRKRRQHRKPRDYDKKVLHRFELLRRRGNYKIPAHVAPVIEAIVDYLEGTTNRLTFK